MNEIEAEFDDDSDEVPREGNEVYKCKELIHDNLVSSGQMDLLKRMIQNRLAQSGWTYSLRKECIEYIKNKGPENVNVSHMIEDIHSVGRARFPEDIKKELYTFLYDFAKTYIEIDESAPPPTEAEKAYSGTGFPFHYQSRDAIPDPGLGVGVVPSNTDGSTSSSCSTSISSDGVDDEGSSRSRSSTPQPSDLPLLLPENLEIQETEHSDSDEEDDNEAEEAEEDEELEGEDEGEEVYIEGYDLQLSEGVDGEYILGDQIQFEGDGENFLGTVGDGEIEVQLDATRAGGRFDHEDESSSNTTNNDEGEDELMDV